MRASPPERERASARAALLGVLALAAASGAIVALARRDAPPALATAPDGSEAPARDRPPLASAPAREDAALAPGAPAPGRRTRLDAAATIDERIAALDEIGVLPREGDDLETVRAALLDDAWYVRAAAIRAARRLGPDATPVSDRLVALVGSNRREEQRDAIRALGAISGPGFDALDLLERRVSPIQDAGLSAAAVEALALAGEAGVARLRRVADAIAVADATLVPEGRAEAAHVVPTLRALLESDSADLRRFALRSAAECGAAGGDLAPAVLARLERGDREETVLAAEALGGVGAGREDVAAALRARLEDPDRRLRGAAARALASVSRADAK